MSLEDDVKALTTAVTRLTDAMAKVGTPVAAAATEAKRSVGRPRLIPFDEVKAVAQKVKDEKTGPRYFQFLKTFGASQLAELDKSKYPEFIAAAEVLLAEAPAVEMAEAGDEL